MNKKKGLLLLALPAFVSASANYEDSVDYANRYINTFNNYDRYLYIRQNEKEFIRGGFLSKNEYSITNLNGNSYLSPGIEYWTLTDANANKKYVIDYSLKELNVNDKSGVRVTEYIKPEITVTGSGTYSSPWLFNEEYKVTAISSNLLYGTIESSDAIQTITKGQAAIIKFYNKTGYKLQSANCTNSSITVTDTTVTIPNIKGDTNCVLNFSPRDDIPYIVNYYTENLNGNDYKLEKIDSLVGTTNETISLLPEEIAQKYPDLEYNRTKSNTEGIINPEQTLTLNVYLDRKKYTVKATSSNLKYGTVIDEDQMQIITKGQEAIIRFIANNGYKYSSSSCSKASYDSSNNSLTLKDVNTDANCVLNFVPRDDIPYIINYYQENAEDNNYANIKIDTLTGVNDSQIALTIKEIEDKYAGFIVDTTKSILSGKVNADNRLSLNVYLNRKQYKVSLAAGTGISSVTTNSTTNNIYKYGQNVIINATVQSGYVWSSWTGTIPTTTRNYVFTMPNSNVNNTATATASAVPYYPPSSGGDGGTYCDATCQMMSNAKDWYNNGANHSDNNNLAGYTDDGQRIPGVVANPDCVAGGGCWYDGNSGVWYTGSNGDTNNPLFEDELANDPTFNHPTYPSTGTGSSNTCIGNGC